MAAEQRKIPNTNATSNPVYTKIIKPSEGWNPLNLGELWQYREMLWFMIWRDLKVRYKQTVLGMLWAIIQPFTTMIVFSFVFGRLAQMPSDGIPYPLFSFVGLLPWTFFSNGLSKASGSLVANSSLIKKIYFPRLLLPISAVASGIIDFFLSFLMLIVLMLYYVVSAPAAGGGSIHFQVTANIVWLPLLLLLTFISALGVSLWFAALNVSFRDVGQAISFITRIGLYLTPVAYPTSALPDALKVISALNPMTGVVEGFRWALLGTNTAPQPTILISAVISVILLVTGAYYFRRAESSFADLV